MAQPSKKSHIARQALDLFLEYGIKGTSVDMVVRAAEVSKPTVYNHFQDKAQLLFEVLQLWLAEQAEPQLDADCLELLMQQVEQHWLSPQARRLYALLLGEGSRAPQAVQLFLQDYDQAWRRCLAAQAQRMQLDPELLQAQVSHSLLTNLWLDNQ